MNEHMNIMDQGLKLDRYLGIGHMQMSAHGCA